MPFPAPRVQHWIVWCLLVVAFLARLTPVLRGGGIRGLLGYDDGVYFGAAEALWSGRLPYRDFLLLHPPGVFVVLTPFAGLAHLIGDPSGLAVARVTFMGIGAVNAILVYRVASRVSATAGVTAGLLYAVWGPATYAERTTLLEPLVNLGLLFALLVLAGVRGRSRPTRRQLTVAGLALGAALAVKLWALVPLLVLAAWVWRQGRLRDTGHLVGVAVGAAAAVCLPFFLAAPGPMLRMVVLDQISRPDNGVPTLRRLADVAGAGTATGTLAMLAVTALLTIVAAASVVALRAQPTARVWVALLAAQGALLLTAPSYYRHYGTYVAPALALVVGAAIGTVARHAAAHAPRLRPALAGTAAVALLAVAGAGQLDAQGRGVQAGRIDAALRTAHCVAADSAAVLEVTNLLTRDLRRGCPLALDVTGTTYDRPTRLIAGRPSDARRSNPAWQSYLRATFGAADATILVQQPADGLTTKTRAWLTRGRRVYGRKAVGVWVR